MIHYFSILHPFGIHPSMTKKSVGHGRSGLCYFNIQYDPQWREMLTQKLYLIIFLKLVTFYIQLKIPPARKYHQLVQVKENTVQTADLISPMLSTNTYQCKMVFFIWIFIRPLPLCFYVPYETTLGMCLLNLILGRIDFSIGIIIVLHLL